MTEQSRNRYAEFAENIARIRQNVEGPFTGPELGCTNTQTHPAHDDCPGVSDPFALLPDA